MQKTLKRVLSLLLAVVMLLPQGTFGLTSTAQTNIPSNAVELNGHYYYLYTDVISWSSAKAYCERLGGHLATITSSAENNVIASMITKSPSTYWIGAQYVNHVWQWVTGENWTYDNWAANEPAYKVNGTVARIDGDCNVRVLAEHYVFKKGEWDACQHTDASSHSVKLSGFVCEWESAKQGPVKDYNATAAVEYAHRYGVRYNREWYFYADGGDCANFVSQCLYAGGMAMDGEWGSLDFNNRGFRMWEPMTWIRANNLVAYLQRNGAEVIWRPSESQVELGDLIFYHWSGQGNREDSLYLDHSAIVTGFSGSTPLVCSHSTDPDGGQYDIPWQHWHNFNNIDWCVVKLHGRICESNNAQSYQLYQTSPSDTDVIRITERRGSEGYGMLKRDGTYGWMDLSNSAYLGSSDKIEVKHMMGGWYTAVKATCTTAGYDRRDCQRCGYSETRATGGGSHVPGAEATCTTPQLCTACGKTLTPALGHLIGDWEVIQESTCTAQGKAVRYCSRESQPGCGYAREEKSLPLAAHQWRATQNGATCTSEGWVDYECAVCHKLESREANLEEDKKWTDWVDVPNSNITDETLYRTKTQYRLVNKEFKTASTDTLSGYTLYDTTFTVNWDGNVEKYDCQKSTNDTYRYLGTESQTINQTYLYRYRKWDPSENWWSYSLNKLDGYEEEGYWVTTDSVFKEDVFGTGVDTYNSHEATPGVHYAFWKGGTRDIQKTWYKYQSGTKIYTYHFFKWSDWSDWSDDELVAENENQKVETRTLYSYRLIAFGHDPVVSEVLYPTCTENGYTKYECSRCHTALEALTSIENATGHNNMSEWENYDAEKYPDVVIPEKKPTDVKIGNGPNYVILATESDPWQIRFCQNTDKNTGESCDYYELKCGEVIYVLTDSKLPTCTEDGYRLYKRSANVAITYHFDDITEIIPKTGHGDWDSFVSKQPSCTEQGEETCICSHMNPVVNSETGEITYERCNYTETRTVPLLLHNLEKTDEVPATCTQDGLAEYYTCTCCKKTFKDAAAKEEFTAFEEIKIDALGHKPAHEHNANNNVCEDGCKQLIEHNDETFVEHIDGNCQNPVEDIYKCQRDGCTYTETVYTVIEHDWKEKARFDRTCLVGGFAIDECTICHDTRTRQLSKPFGHEFLKKDGTTTDDYTDPDVIWTAAEATECSAGTDLEYVKCIRYGKDNCAEYHEKGTPATHTVKEVEYPADCINGAYINIECINCTFKKFDRTISRPLGHDWGEVTYTWSEDRMQCTAFVPCGRDHDHDVTETSNVKKDVIYPTCTENGSVTYTAEFTNKAFENEPIKEIFKVQTVTEVLFAPGHDWGEVTYTWSDDLTECTALKPCNKNHDHDITETVKADTKIEDSDCTKEGLKTFTAEFKNEAFETQVKTAKINLKEHTSKSVGAVAPTCVIDGTKAYTYCSVCNLVLTVSGKASTVVVKTSDIEAFNALIKDPAKGHDYVASETAPTCLEKGYTTHTCSRCNDSYTDNYKNAHGHLYGEYRANDDFDYAAGTGTHTATCQYQTCTDATENHTVTKQHTFCEVERKNATTTTEGFIKYKCNDCGFVYTKSLDKVVPSELEEEKNSVYVDGKSVITLSASAATSYVNVITKSQKPVDVVLVLDQSGSMSCDVGASANEKTRSKWSYSKYPKSKASVLIDCANNFIGEIYNNYLKTGAEHRVALVGFAYGEYSGYNYTNTGILATNNYGSVGYTQAMASTKKCADALISIKNAESLTKSVKENVDASGATAADKGLNLAKSILASGSEDNREKIIVFITDGVPTYSSLSATKDVTNCASQAIKEANEIKNIVGAKIYTVAVDPDADTNASFTSDSNGIKIQGNQNSSYDINRFLHIISSNYTNVTSMNDLAGKTPENGGYYMSVRNTEDFAKVFSNVLINEVAKPELFDKVTLFDTLSDNVTLTLEDEKAMRDDLTTNCGMRDEDIVVVRDHNGTTHLEFHNVLVKIIDGKYIASVTFKASLNENALVKGEYDTNTADAGVQMKDVTVKEFKIPQVTVDADRHIVVYTINGEVYSIMDYNLGDDIEVPATEIATWNVDGKTVTKDVQYIEAESISDVTYTVTWNMNGETVINEYRLGDEVTAPTVVTAPDGKEFAGWTPSVTRFMPSYNLVYTAIYEDVHVHNYTIKYVSNGDGTHYEVKTCVCGEVVRDTGNPQQHSLMLTTSVDDSGEFILVCSKCGIATGETIKITTNSIKHSKVLNMSQYLDGAEIQPNKNGVEINVYTGKPAGTQLKVTIVNADGSIEPNATVMVDYNGYITFTAPHFSYYVLTPVDENGNPVDELSFEEIYCAANGHRYTDAVVAPTCTEDGYTVHTCSVCGYNYTDAVIKATGHTDDNKDGTCDNCGAAFGTTEPDDPSANCSCLCHKSGILKLLWKIINFFRMLFGMDQYQYCDCGAKHW